jgi:competence protein ComEC
VLAVVTLVLVTIYLFITGLPISAVRAYVMITLVLLAVIFRRQVDPMRSLAITALIMLAFSPANLLDPGFQLSFAATLAIIALVEVMVLSPHALEQSRPQKIWRLFISMVLVSVVADIATTPLVIAQFNNVSPYGIFANMLATPLVSFYLMPTVALFFVLLPFGLQHIALWLMKWGIMALLAIGRWVAAFPHAQLFSPSIPGYGVALFALGLMWVCLWRTRVRYYGPIAMALGVATLLLHNSPDMLIGGNLKQIAFNSNEGYVLARGRPTSMLPELWANGLGYKELDEAGAPNWRCDKLGCVARVKGRTVAFPFDASALLDDCRNAQLIVTAFADMHCASPAVTVIGGEPLARSNVTAIWFEKDGGMRLETSAQWQGKRPWSAQADADEE